MEIEAWWVFYLLIWFVLTLASVVVYATVLRRRVLLYNTATLSQTPLPNTIQPSASKTFFECLNSGTKLPSEENWKSLATEMDTRYPAFTDQLIEKHKLSEVEYRVSLLLKAGFSPLQISQLVCRSKEGVTSIRRRLSQKVLHSESPSPKEWDQYIQSL